MLPCQSQERVQQQKLWWSNRWEIARHEKLTWYTRFLKGKAKTGFYGRLRSAQLLLRTGDSDTVAVTGDVLTLLLACKGDGLRLC
ncbi:Hypothetical predicted protein [Podarcis lilfordi]|uniref:Uncharacterized protein n=1 Tax=Podarcis lilfordi TaxID=74358 RepID=A0AA35KF48_9SAUR|nr:Hypothetical predicted protein [Podarcis lilfordi]